MLRDRGLCERFRCGQVECRVALCAGVQVCSLCLTPRRTPSPSAPLTPSPPHPPHPQVLGTVEGKEGLLHALQAAIQRDGMLALQLRLLLQAGAAAPGGTSGAPGPGPGAGAGAGSAAPVAGPGAGGGGLNGPTAQAQAP